jgi:hypothetical protein
VRQVVKSIPRAKRRGDCSGVSMSAGEVAKSLTAKSFFGGIRLRALRLRRNIGGIVLVCPIFQL